MSAAIKKRTVIVIDLESDRDLTDQVQTDLRFACRDIFQLAGARVLYVEIFEPAQSDLYRGIRHPQPQPTTGK